VIQPSSVTTILFLRFASAIEILYRLRNTSCDVKISTNTSQKRGLGKTGVITSNKNEGDNNDESYGI